MTGDGAGRKRATVLSGATVLLAAAVAYAAVGPGVVTGRPTDLPRVVTVRGVGAFRKTALGHSAPTGTASADATLSRSAEASVTSSKIRPQPGPHSDAKTRGHEVVAPEIREEESEGD